MRTILGYEMVWDIFWWHWHCIPSPFPHHSSHHWMPSTATFSLSEVLQNRTGNPWEDSRTKGSFTNDTATSTRIGNFRRLESLKLLKRFCYICFVNCCHRIGQSPMIHWSDIRFLKPYEKFQESYRYERCITTEGSTNFPQLYTRAPLLASTTYQAAINVMGCQPTNKLRGLIASNMGKSFMKQQSWPNKLCGQCQIQPNKG